MTDQPIIIGPSRPPPENGVRLFTAQRQGFRDQPDSELRLNLCEYEGRPYLSLRLWSRGAGGEFWPTNKGCSPRIDARQSSRSGATGGRLSCPPEAARRGSTSSGATLHEADPRSATPDGSVRGCLGGYIVKSCLERIDSD
jgi:hypothetical protein